MISFRQYSYLDSNHIMYNTNIFERFVHNKDIVFLRLYCILHRVDPRFSFFQILVHNEHYHITI